MKRISLIIALTVTMAIMLAPLTIVRVAAQGKVVEPTDRTILPIPEPVVPNSTVFNARNATPPDRFVVRAPKDAPNVLIVLIDDMGFGQSSAFGGPIHMPTV
jgi:hypothetical protein